MVHVCTRILNTLQFSRLNECNVSLVAIYADLVMQRLSSEATISPDTMMRYVVSHM